MSNLLAFGVGLIFAVGLGLSGMTQPTRVIGFLDVGGAWDPSLLFVMASATLVYGVAYRLSRRLERPLVAQIFADVSKRTLDARLLVGAAIFGLGWGLAGFCPGPAIASLGAGVPEAGLAVFGMFLGSLVHHLVTREPAPPVPARSAP